MNLIKNEDGTVSMIIESEVVTRQDLVDMVDEHRTNIETAENCLAEFDSLTEVVAEPVVEPVVEPTPEVEAPAVEPTPEPATETPTEIAPIDSVQLTSVEVLQPTALVNGEEVPINEDGTVNVETPEATVSIDTTPDAPVSDEQPPLTIQ